MSEPPSEPSIVPAAGVEAAVPTAPAASQPAAAQPAAAPRAAVAGRRYGFLCAYCSSRLEATESVAGQHGTCPTCGKTITIPILDGRGRLIDPESGQVIRQDPHPVHAYAAAGEKAPQIVAGPNDQTRLIRCPRCGRLNPLAANNCNGCGLPFTMEGTMADTVSGTNTWAIAALVLGIVGIPGSCLLGIPPILAIVFGAIALRGMRGSAESQQGSGMAIAGIILGVIGLLLMVLLIGRLF